MRKRPGGRPIVEVSPAYMASLEEGNSQRSVEDELATHPKAKELGELIRTLVLTAYDERRPALESGLEDAAVRIGVTELDAETSFGNVFRAVRKSRAASVAERRLLAHLLWSGLAASVSHWPESAVRLWPMVAWTSAYSSIDPCLYLPSAGPARGAMLTAGLGLLQQHDDGSEILDRPSAVITALTLVRAEHAPEVGRLRDPLFRGLIDSGIRSPLKIEFSAELAPTPRSAWMTVLLCVTFVLPLLSVARFVGRTLLRFRVPAAVSIDNDRMSIRSSAELLGRSLGERTTVVSLASLAKVSRVARFARLPVYVGLASFLVGTFLGTRLFVSGLRAGSPEFIGLGALVLFFGLCADYLFEIWPRRAAKTCSLRFDGPESRVHFTAVDSQQAEIILNKLRAI